MKALKSLNSTFAKFDNVVKIRTTPNARTEGEWGFEHTKSVFNNEITPFLKSLKEIFNVFDRDLLNEIMEGIVEQAKVEQPLDKELDFAFKNSQRIQELLVYVRDTCPNVINLSAKKVESSKTSNSNTPVLSSTGLKCSTSKCRSKPTGNKRNDKISQTPSSSKKAKIIESKNDNHSEPNHTWGSTTIDIPSSSSLVMTVRFGNDNIVRIMGYGDYQLGNVTISRVYYIEGLGHNLFFVGQFCDANLEVAFHKNTCFIRNLEGVDLLFGSRDTNLYIISLDDMLKTSLICLLSKASKTKSWLWHRRLSHLNFGKSKKSSNKPKVEDTNQEKLYLLHMDLCSPIRLSSINGKRYILVIVEDYSRFTWVKFLRTKDEAPEAIIKCIKNIQVCLNSTVRNVQTDNGTKFVNQTLRELYENVSISHQTSVASTPQQNDIVKRQNQTLIEAAHTIDDLGKLDAKADIGIFVGYVPAKKSFRIYNKRTQKIIETIHVTFDELTAMASKQFSSRYGLHSMTPVTSCLGLIPNVVS
ncbi:retrovirus-related pol polyprotein from transposon TNT 1-94 [Tanacetum coccineum]